MLVLAFRWRVATQNPLSQSTDLRDLNSLRGRQLPHEFAGGSLPLHSTQLASESPAGLMQSSLLSPYVTEPEGLYPTQLLQGPLFSAWRGGQFWERTRLLFLQSRLQKNAALQAPRSLHCLRTDVGAEAALIWADTTAVTGGPRALSTCTRPGRCCHTCWLHRAVAAVPDAVGLGVSALEGKFGSIQELGAHIEFIFFPYILCGNDCSKCSKPLLLWELCWMMDTDNKLILVFSPSRLFLPAGVQHHRSYSAKV